nr:hypothetical protein HAGR004_12030 [Bdellovibrio sp. HAGR004]
MDFVAEILLGAVDKDLSSRLKKEGVSKFRILRYRDDYRIFVHNQTDGMLILKNLSEVLADYGLKLNSSKTIRSNSVIRDSIKQDKLFYLIHLSSNQNITKHLLLIHNLSERYPDSGSLIKALGVFYKKIESKSLNNQKLDVLASIIVDIMYSNPKSIPHCTAILSLLLNSYPKISNKKRVIKKIKVKFNSIPNTGLLQLWLQRITLPVDRKLKYSEPLCNIVINEDIEIWNNTWIINSKLKSALKKSEIVIEDKVNSLNPKVSYDEVSLFDY